jgi:hypothetical protein
MEVQNLGRRRSGRDVEQRPVNPKPGSPMSAPPEELRTSRRARSVDATGRGLDTGCPLEFSLGQSSEVLLIGIACRRRFTGAFLPQVLEYAIG